MPTCTADAPSRIAAATPRASEIPPVATTGTPTAWTAVTQAQYVLAEHDELVDLVISGAAGLTQLAGFFERSQHTHDERMRELGLA